MARNTVDPIGCVPSSAAVEKALDQARRRVSTLEFLLDISRGVEARMRVSQSDCVGGREHAAVACDR
jgi:hypothetical protein